MDIATLKYASSLLREGLKYEEVTQRLEQRPLEGEVFTEGEIPPKPENKGPEQEESYSIQPIEFFKQIIDAKDETISVLKAEVAWLRLPWYRRVFRDPPE